MYVSSIDGSSVYYEKNGCGPSILLIHGFGGDHNIWHETGWVDNLINDFTVITFDLRGCGKSEISDEPDFYSINNHLSDILAIIKQEQIINR